MKERRNIIYILLSSTVICPIYYFFTAPWTLPCSSGSPLLTWDHWRKGCCCHEAKTVRTCLIFAGLWLLHTIYLEAVNGIPFIHSPVDSNGGAGSWVLLLRYYTRCLWDWMESLQLLFTPLYIQVNLLHVQEATKLLIFPKVVIFTEEIYQIFEIWTILVKFCSNRSVWTREGRN